uniref:Digalactosyldiacylglycerol synthase n=1 Tax=Salix viminalis TaxID=40686 RepID=A0A6N2MSL3_SALVM
MDNEKQHIAIFTTASLPWMTGTAVNPLFRAAFLAKDGSRKVTLVIPWLSLQHQKLVYPNNITFASPSEQQVYVRQWLQERVSFSPGFSIRFYPAKFAVDKRSILAVGDISEVIPDEEADVAVLEEPEHLTWFHHGKRWKTKFRLVIGIIHTNYLEYIKREKNGRIKAMGVKFINSWVVEIYCHKVIRLSAATQDYPNSIICNVHGVNPKFLEIGKKKIELQQSGNGNQAFTKGAYYIGKMVWSKGFRVNFLRQSKRVNWLEVIIWQREDSDNYKVFLNPSTTDVVCTTTAEALAMGKIVVCANHPSNDFFKQFPNCRTYDNSNGFVEATRKALTEEPAELTGAQRHELSWEAATERFLRVADLDQVSARKPAKSLSKSFASISLSTRMEDVSAYLHHVALGFETSRRAFGAIPGSLQPDEEQCKELGLAIPAATQGSKVPVDKS